MLESRQQLLLVFRSILLVDSKVLGLIGNEAVQKIDSLNRCGFVRDLHFESCKLSFNLQVEVLGFPVSLTLHDVHQVLTTQTFLDFVQELLRE